MTLLSAEEDFKVRSLAAFDSPLAKLAYCAELRTAGGRYRHWGLARNHGEEAADTAIARAHGSVFLEVLRSPIRTLIVQERMAAANAGSQLLEALSQLRSNVADLLPTLLAGGTRQHLSSVLAALWALETERVRATRLAA